MEKRIVFKLLINFFIVQSQVFDTQQVPIEPTKITLTTNGDKFQNFQYTIIELENKTVIDIKNDTTHYDDQTMQVNEGKALEKLREQIIIAKRSQQKIFSHDPEDILFMLTALILLCFHLFFMDMFIRMTRTRFQTNGRFHYLSTLHLFLAFLVCAVYFLLILLHYRDSQYCG